MCGENIRPRVRLRASFRGHSAALGANARLTAIRIRYLASYPRNTSPTLSFGLAQFAVRFIKLAMSLFYLGIPLRDSRAAQHICTNRVDL